MCGYHHQHTNFISKAKAKTKCDIWYCKSKHFRRLISLYQIHLKIKKKTPTEVWSLRIVRTYFNI